MKFLKAKKPVIKTSDLPSLKEKLGLKNTAPEEKIIFALERLRSGNPKTWKSLGITSSDFDRFNIKGYNK